MVFQKASKFFAGFAPSGTGTACSANNMHQGAGARSNKPPCCL